jgi:hypothetical protein
MNRELLYRVVFAVFLAFGIACFFAGISFIKFLDGIAK